MTLYWNTFLNLYHSNLLANTRRDCSFHFYTGREGWFVLHIFSSLVRATIPCSSGEALYIPSEYFLQIVSCVEYWLQSWLSNRIKWFFESWCVQLQTIKLQGLFKGKFGFSRTKIFLKESYTIFTSSSLLSSSLAYVHVEDTRLRQRNIPK